jgi:hypothetical protein
MRNIIFILGLILSLFLACSKTDKEGDDDQPVLYGNERPGSIPGFGNRGGMPTGTPFELPPGVTLVETIIGNEEGATEGSCKLDGAGFFVSVTVKLERDTALSGTGPLEVLFPPGLIVVSRIETKQNGLLLDSVLLVMPPVPQGSTGGSCVVNLLFSCLNELKGVADPTVEYDFGPITNSELVNAFLKEIKNKKINYSHFEPGSSDWFQIQEGLQDRLWKITDGEGLTLADINWLRQLPNE